MSTQSIAQILTNPSNPQFDKAFDLQRAAFNHAKRVLKLGRSTRVTIDRYTGSVGWGAAIVFVQDRGQQMGYQVTIVMEWDYDRNLWAYRGMVDGIGVKEFVSVGMPPEVAVDVADNFSYL
ncbi:MAG: hypothetical protein EA001_05530 [Oscillatoriales cyanobacterium]|nr:MAG: hypothetical protein EA001_05530 [Oscillatoriales cyanobacterium]